MSEDYGEYDLSEYNTHVDNVKYHHEKKKTEIIKCIEELVIVNYPRKKIAGKIYADLEGFASKPYLQLILASLELTDQKHNPVDVQKRLKALEKNAVIVQNQDGTLQIMEDPNPELLELLVLNSSTSKDVPEGIPDEPIPPNPYETQNIEWIAIYTEHEKHAKDIVAYLRKNDFERMLPKEQSNEAKDLARGALSICKQIWDNRNTVLIQTQWKLHEFVNGSTITHGAKQYLKWLKDTAEISSKQVTKILRGWTRDVSIEYEPNDVEEAKMSGFSGLVCPDDGSKRVKLENGVAHCYRCEKDWLVKAKRLAEFKDEQQEDGSEE